MEPLTLAQWRDHGVLIEHKGHRIFTAAHGYPNLPPILTLHGFPTASYDFAWVAALNGSSHDVIVFDMLGYGFSDKPRGYTYSLFEQADIAETVMEHYHVTECMLLAHDMGDSVALELLRRDLARPQKRFTRVILMNGSLLLKYYHPLITQRLLLHPLIGPVMTGLNLVRYRSFAAQFGSLFAQRPPESELRDFWSLITTHGGTRVYHRLIQYLNERKLHEYEWLDALAAHPAPLTVIWGQRDPVSVPQIGDAVVERRPDARYLKLENVGHYPHWEAPEIVAKAIYDECR